MKTLLSYVAVQGGQIKRASLEVLSRCRALADAHGARLEAVIVAPDADAHVDAVKAYGPAKIYTVSDPIFAQHLNTPLLDALDAVLAQAQPSVLAFASSEAVKDVLGALAARRGAPALADVSAFDLSDGGLVATRPVLASKFLARTEAEADLVLVSVRSGVYEATPADAPAEAEVVAVDFSFDAGSLKQTLREVVAATTGGAVDLSEARVVVAAGRGVKDAEGKRLVEELAEVLGAAIGSSRAVVENGLFPATSQVGQTGKVVSPELYFAVGISGAIQHVAGMSNSRVIVAVNRDADAPIFKYATYGLVGDLYKILPALTEALKQG